MEHGQGPATRSSREWLAHLITSARLFASSYTPLFAILAAKGWGTPFGWGFALLALFGLLETFSLLVHGSRAGTLYLDVTHIQEAGSEVAAYVATYLLPFVWVSPASARDIVAITLYLLTIFIIGHRARLYHINPTLYVTGRSIVSITTASGQRAYLVCTSIPKHKARIRVAQIHGLYVLRGV